MSRNDELTDARRLLRAHEAALHTAVAGNYQYRSSQWFRDQAAQARAVAEAAERVAFLMDRAGAPQ